MNNSKNRFEELIVGESRQIRKAIDEAKKIAARSTLTTLIYGESGTGKELFARLIYNLSDLADKPFVDINCGAIPETLLESELFGYEKGAFTGANNRKKGLLELADGGTVFLDEISNTSLNFQVKLLKAVENKRFRRVGGVEEINISTRIIAASNVDLYHAVQEGKFREDLYYRLNVCQIRIPPLRERENDVEILARHFIDKFNKESGRKVKGLTPGAIQFLHEYHWPGNVRQLKHAIERAVLLENSEWINLEHLTPHSERKREPAQHTHNNGNAARSKENPEHSPAAAPSQKFDAVTLSPGGSLAFEIPDEGIALEEFERQIILSALEKTSGNLSQTARLLKISRGKLRYRMEKLNIAIQHSRNFTVSIIS